MDQVAMDSERRSVRKGIEEILAALRADIEAGDDFEEHPYSIDPEERGLSYLFERSGMDPRKPGHWQMLLRAVADQVYPEEGGRREIWTEQEHQRLLKAVLIRRKKAKTATVVSICGELAGTFSIDINGIPARFSAQTLQHRVQVLLKQARLAVKNGAASKLQRDIAAAIRGRS